MAVEQLSVRESKLQKVGRMSNEVFSQGTASDRRAIFLDIKAHVSMNLHVLVRTLGCSFIRHIHADGPPSLGKTRVVGDNHLVFPLLSVCSYSV
jgi:hypothetical protein